MKCLLSKHDNVEYSEYETAVYEVAQIYVMQDDGIGLLAAGRDDGLAMFLQCACK